MKIRLNELSEIKTGYTIRGSIGNYQGGQVQIIQATDVIHSNFSNLNSIQIENFENYLLKNGDVLLTIKGAFKATVFEELTRPTAATSSIAIFRVNSKRILSEYLVLILNSIIGQRELLKLAIGSSIKAISIAELRNLEIEVPDMSKQKFIVSFSQNIKQQSALLEIKQQKLQQIHNQITDKIIKGDL